MTKTKRFRDDRRYTTSFGVTSAVSRPGKHDQSELLAVADWAEERGFMVAAEVLRNADPHVHVREPDRDYGWTMPDRGWGVTHFWPKRTYINSGSHYTQDRCLCRGARTPSYRLRWYPESHSVCQRCLDRLRTSFSDEYPDALAAIERWLVERATKGAG